MSGEQLDTVQVQIPSPHAETLLLINKNLMRLRREIEELVSLRELYLKQLRANGAKSIDDVTGVMEIDRASLSEQ